MSITVQSVFDYPVTPGRYLIEASAGTGKTYTIAQLVRRVILETNIPPSQILVTTFSKAAAAELKDRIGKTLNDALNGWKGEDGDVKPDAMQLLKLRLAIASFDEIMITTIHSFCQKMLRDFALETRERFEQELVASDSDIRESLLQAFWRNRFYGSDEIPPCEYGKLRNAVMAPSDLSRTKYKYDEKDPAHLLYMEAIEYIRQHLEEEKNKAGVLTFDDLILHFRRALESPEGTGLAERIRHRCKAVFVDEFQDTDDNQFQVFDRCFPVNSSSLFYMIGDPKQSIYAFRNADILVYLRAKKGLPEDHCFTLAKNFRSSPDMVRAVNTMFTGKADLPDGFETPNVFMQEGIPFVSVSSGHPAKSFQFLENGKPLTAPIEVIGRSGTKTRLTPLILKSTARTVASLLSKERNITFLPNRDEGTKPVPLRASDIAILIPVNDQAQILIRELNRYGIAASSVKVGSVYKSQEAEELRDLMKAMLIPTDDIIRKVMLSSFFQIRPETLDAFTNNEEFQHSFDEWRRYFLECAAFWREKNFFAMMGKVLDSLPPQMEDSPRSRILLLFNGERIMTNILQLTELIHREEQKENLSPEAVLDFLLHAIRYDVKDAAGAEVEADANSSQLRLERDSDTVQIMTSFASKGLQFPVVFIPFAERGTPGSRLRGEVSFKLNTPEGPEINFNNSVPEFKIQDLQTQTRLLYVAMTRGEYLTFLTLENQPTSAAHSLLKGAEGAISLALNPEQPPEQRANEILKLGKSLPEGKKAGWLKGESPLIHVQQDPPDVDAGHLRVEEKKDLSLSFREAPEIPHGWRILSYSSYHYGDHSAAASQSPVRDLDDLENSGSTNPETSGTDRSFRSFSRGINAGLFVHNILEKLARPEHAESPCFKSFAEDPVPGKVRNMLTKRLTAAGYKIDAGGIVTERLLNGLCNTFRTKLPGLSVSLGELESGKCASEQEFHLNANRPAALSGILRIMRESASEEVRNKMLPASGSETEQQGILNGIIDLIFEFGGKYYIADWKTNYLGAHEADYTREKVGNTMSSCGYFLQYHLYVIALYLILQQRIPDFNYEKHFGGVYYFFLRGMKPGTDHGIWFDRPPENCIRRLLALFRKGEEK